MDPQLDLDGAWRAVLSEFGADDIPDILRWEDYKVAWPSLRAELTAELEAGTYRPLPARIVEVPKNELMVRPIALLHPRDRVVYRALVMSLAPQIEAALSEAVFSARLHPTTHRLTDQRRSWVRMQKEGRSLHVDQDFGFMLSTDVVSYFEYVDLEILSKDLRSLEGVNEKAVGLLSSLLNDLQRASDVWGLPQGPEASSILGNYYLQPVDRELQMHPVVALRFQDDIKVFGHDAATLRRVLRDVTRVMRGRHLNVAVSKTRILEGAAVLDDLEDARKDAIQYGIKADLPTVTDDLHSLFDDAVAQEPVDARDVRFAVYRLAVRKDGHAIPWILNNLARVPYLAALLVDYLSGHLEGAPEIEARARAFLLDPNRNLYPWVELHLIRMFARTQSIVDDTLSGVWSILKDNNKDLLVREQAARCIGRHSRPGDPAILRSLFMGSTDSALRRALLVAITEAGGTTRDKSFLATVATSAPDLAATAQLLRSGAVIPPP